MDLKSKRKREVEDQKNQRKEEVIAAAAKVFQEKGIEVAKMTDVANAAEIGVASVYRYFKTKPELAVEAALLIWREEVNGLYERYKVPSFQEKSGIEQVRGALEVFKELYRDHQPFIKFIYEFDTFVVKEGISKDKLKQYETEVLQMEQVLGEALEKGKNDGSIRKNIDSKIFYFSMTHTLMSLCQKLVLRGDLFESDAFIDGETQLDFVIDMALSYIQS